MVAQSPTSYQRFDSAELKLSEDGERWSESVSAESVSLRWGLTYRLGGFDENLGSSQLELVLVHIDRAQQVKDPLFFISPPRWPGLFG